MIGEKLIKKEKGGKERRQKEVGRRTEVTIKLNKRKRHDKKGDILHSCLLCHENTDLGREKERRK